jgi:hypothetical protein
MPIVGFAGRATRGPVPQAVDRLPKSRRSTPIGGPAFPGAIVRAPTPREAFVSPSAQARRGRFVWQAWNPPPLGRASRTLAPRQAPAAAPSARRQEIRVALPWLIPPDLAAARSRRSWRLLTGGTGAPEPPVVQPPFADQDLFFAGIVCGMAVSEVGIANMALTLIGEEPITSFDEASKPARFVCQHYENVRDFVLRQHCWSCATRRATLALSATPPDWGFANAYQLPTGYLRLVEKECIKGPFAIEEDKLLSDESPMRIAYIFRLIDVARMDPLLQQAIAAMLAAELAIAIAQNRELMKTLFQLYQSKLEEAKTVDAIEGPIETAEMSTWLEARLSGAMAGW